MNVDRVYIPDVIFQVSDDGGKTLRSLGQRYMHVDNHIIWVDPKNTNHLLVGNQIASELFAVERAKLKALIETDVPAIEKELERLGAPYTPGRLPR